MHPLFAQQRYLILYLVVFVQVGWLLGEILVRSTGAAWLVTALLVLPLMAVHAFSCLMTWYLCRSLPLVATRSERLVSAHLAAGVVTSGALVALGTLWAGALAGQGFAEAPQVMAAGRTLVFVFAFLLFSLAVAVHYVVMAALASQDVEKRAWELRVLAREAELKALRAQIDPHFLFNSLNTISSLVASEPETARQMCVRLAELLRRSLRLGARDEVPLAEELALAELYLSLEQVRFGERLAFHLTLDDGLGTSPVPPLVLQPLIENAVRHGIAHRLDGGTVAVRASRRHGRLVIRVENPYDADARRPGEGIGLANVRRRLETRYGEDAGLRVEESEDVFRVDVVLPGAVEVPETESR